MIPRLVHRVWLGPNPPPLEHDYSRQWARTNPAWRLCTWTDETVRSLFPLVCQAEYDAAPTYVHRADIVYVEAVYRCGGVAAGYDMEPLRGIDTFVGPDLDCWCTPDADGFAGSAFFGATPEHPTIALILRTLKARIARDGWQMPHISTGPYLWGEVFGRFHEQAAELGMAVLGDWKTAYPVRYWERAIFEQPRRYHARTRNSVMVHKFAGSWLNPNVDITVRGGAR